MWILSMFRARLGRLGRPDKESRNADRRARRIKSAMTGQQIERERGNAESRGF